jgi:hypothetical protein
MTGRRIAGLGPWSTLHRNRAEHRTVSPTVRRSRGCARPAASRSRSLTTTVTRAAARPAQPGSAASLPFAALRLSTTANSSSRSNRSSGSRRAATDRRTDQHDRWRSVTDRGSARTLEGALTCGFLTLVHDSLTLQCTDRIVGVGSDTKQDGGSTPSRDHRTCSEQRFLLLQDCSILQRLLL